MNNDRSLIQRSRERLKKVRKTILNLFQPFGPLGYLDVDFFKAAITLLNANTNIKQTAYFRPHSLLEIGQHYWSSTWNYCTVEVSIWHPYDYMCILQHRLFISAVLKDTSYVQWCMEPNLLIHELANIWVTLFWQRIHISFKLFIARLLSKISNKM